MNWSANMFGKKGNKPQNRIDCLIGAGTTIEGNITFRSEERRVGKECRL